MIILILFLGACAGTLLTKLLEINHPLISSANHPPLNFSIMISGLINQKPEVLELFKAPVATPSLHMYSNVDNIVIPSRHLASRLTNILLI